MIYLKVKVGQLLKLLVFCLFTDQFIWQLEEEVEDQPKYKRSAVFTCAVHLQCPFLLRFVLHSHLQAYSYLASIGARTEQVNLKLMKYSLELWSAKIAVGAGTKFACFMAGGEHSGGKVNCFIEIFK